MSVGEKKEEGGKKNDPDETLRKLGIEFPQPNKGHLQKPCS